MIVSEKEPEVIDETENITEVAKRRKFNSFRQTNREKGPQKENNNFGKITKDAQMVSEFKDKDKQRAQILASKEPKIDDNSQNKTSTFMKLKDKTGTDNLKI